MQEPNSKTFNGLPAHIQSNFVKDVDGYYYYWPDATGGHYAEHHLRELADALREMNAEWDAYITKELGDSECKDLNEML